MKGAVLNLFPALPVTVESRGGRVYLVGKGNGIEVLDEFRGLISRERIIASARRVLRASVMGGRIMVCLNKQVATVGHISFCEPEGESPLGPITVTVESDRLDKVIDRLAPRAFPNQSGRGTSRTMKSSATTVSGNKRRARSRKPSSSA